MCLCVIYTVIILLYSVLIGIDSIYTLDIASGHRFPRVLFFDDDGDGLSCARVSNRRPQKEYINIMGHVDVGEDEFST